MGKISYAMTSIVIPQLYFIYEPIIHWSNVDLAYTGEGPELQFS
jgi:hypothetical protein